MELLMRCLNLMTDKDTHMHTYMHTYLRTYMHTYIHALTTQTNRLTNKPRYRQEDTDVIDGSPIGFWIRSKIWDGGFTKTNIRF